MSEKVSKKAIVREKLLERQKDAKVIRKILLISTLIFILIAGGLALGGYLYVKSALQPYNPEDKKVRKVEIPIGSSVSGIAAILKDNKIIKDERVFKYYIKFRNEAGFQAGTYELSPSMNLGEIVSSIKTGKIMQEVALKITLPEGKTLQQIAGIIAEKTDENPDQVFKTLNDKAFIRKLQDLYPELITDEIYNENIRYPLEGYLFPATFSFYEEKPGIEKIVTEMLSQTNKVLSQYHEDLTAKNLTPHKLLTFASLVEEEATEKVDRDKIASVFYNRMKIGMPLQTDPTVLYAKGEHKAKVYYKDLKTESPYNTYTNVGLPPGPIANAGVMSIEAALNPAETDFYYFLATSTGDVIFTKTLDQHNREKARYITSQN
ncbi:endolytic transglycosylase MltG [Peribacillus saganii]|uniref:Endolytic murein transglycosylase n=1 Tax=Peribacillus saganii TaxID=2303992 RepID=A0A372LV05_9BACI|nr:endolytic transglycosylase MltG [Peribacillus saganii]RFU71630.1 endolytic transglycosylase MltG [Peribacillus saganii]